MNVLSLFDGMSCGRIALDRAGISYDNYYASEIDKYAIQIAQKNYPDTIQLGDVTQWKKWELPKIDLIMGGSPCQGFSQSGQGLNFEDPRSRLFFDFADILKHYNPKHFLLENVVMRKKEWQDIITEYVGVEPILINSALVSAQSRKRLYWTNIPSATQPDDKRILLKDIILTDAYPVALHNLYGGFKESFPRVFENKSPTLRTPAGGGHIPSFVKEEFVLGCAMRARKKDDEGNRIPWSSDIPARQFIEVRSDNKANCITSVQKDSLLLTPKALEYMDRRVADGRDHWDFGHYSDVRNEKSATVVANFFKGVPYNVFKDWDVIRKFDPVECERLQTIPDNYTQGVSKTQRYKMIGNGWTVDVVVHILKNIK